MTKSGTAQQYFSAIVVYMNDKEEPCMDFMFCLGAVWATQPDADAGSDWSHPSFQECK